MIPQRHSGMRMFGLISGLFWTIFDFSRFTESVANSGTTTRDVFKMYVDTGATANSKAVASEHLIRKGSYSLNYGQDMEISCIFRHYTTSGANGVTWLKIDDDLDATDPDSNAIGFRIDNNALKGIVHNNSSLTVVDLNTTLTDTVVRLRIKFTAGDKIEWYVNDVLKGSSENIPSASESSDIILAVKNGADTSAQEARIGQIAFWEEW